MAVPLSPSRLNRLAECPRCGWLQINEDVDRPSAPFPSLPNGIDRTIKAHFDRHRRQGTLPPAIEGEVDAVLEPDSSFVERCRSWRAGPTYVDDEIEVILRGALDDLLRTPRRRTGRPRLRDAWPPAGRGLGRPELLRPPARLLRPCSSGLPAARWPTTVCCSTTTPTP